MPEMTKTTVDVALDEVHVDGDAQRTLNVKRAKLMAENWNELWAGAITVGRDPADGKLYVCDGHHRMAGAQMAGVPTIAAVVFDNVDRQERARMFLHLNRDRTGVSRYDLYRVALTAGEPNELEVQAILDEYGLGAGSSSSAKTIGSVAALLSIHKRYGPDVLRQTLEAVLHGWRTEGGDRWDSALISGLARLIALNLTNIEPERLTETLRKRLPASWKALIVARAQGPSGSGGRPLIAAAMFAEAYNAGLRVRSRRLKSSR